MNIKERLEIYSQVARLLAKEDFPVVSDIICEIYRQHSSQQDLALVMGLLRLTYQWREHISYWDDVAQLTYERLNNADKLMRGLTWSNN